MTIDWAHFTPQAALLGGLLLGLAAALFILFSGRILGISGILGGLIGASRGDKAWRIAFLAGLALAPWLWRAGGGTIAPRIDSHWGTLIAAGLLVGLGTRYGAGCTSGHGVCGLSRLSARSLVATLIFMAAGFATTFLIRHICTS
ncbi:MAG: YeeE/YedE family protein [Betaproteobacteria bacterium]|nr:YeeE/YedE family protein [Betaproteobacteria bacterium]